MKIIERTHNVLTGEITDIEREETVDEKKVREAAEKQIAKLLAEAEAKEAARQAILDRLGLSSDEAKLLLG